MYTLHIVWLEGHRVKGARLYIPAVLSWVSGEDDIVVVREAMLSVVDFDPRSLGRGA